MPDDDVVERLRRSARLGTEEDIRDFAAALDDLPPQLDAYMLRGLLLAFDDDAEDPQLMFELVHLIEDTPLGVEEAAFVSVVAEMTDRSPSWAETILMRLLNSSAARTALIAASRESPSPNQKAIRVLLDRIGEGTDPVAMAARQAIREL